MHERLIPLVDEGLGNSGVAILAGGAHDWAEVTGRSLEVGG